MKSHTLRSSKFNKKKTFTDLMDYRLGLHIAQKYLAVCTNEIIQNFKLPFGCKLRFFSFIFIYLRLIDFLKICKYRLKKHHLTDCIPQLVQQFKGQLKQS